MRFKKEVINHGNRTFGVYTSPDYPDQQVILEPHNGHMNDSLLEEYLETQFKTNNMKSRLFEYAVLWHPTEKQVKEDGAKSKLISAPTTIMAADQQAATMAAAMSIPAEYKDQLDQVEIAMRPF